MSLPITLYNAGQVREFDRLAIEQHGMPATLLMKRAGKAAFELLLDYWPNTKSIHVLCGGGNNGGDGYVLAALAAQRGVTVTVWQIGQQLTETASAAHDYALQENVLIRPFDVSELSQAFDCRQGVLVDGLLGTGFNGELRQNYRLAIESINQSGWPVLALDLPSGIHPDTGALPDLAVMADVTISFIGQKLGVFIGQGRVHSGERHFHRLDVPLSIYDKLQPVANRLALEKWIDYLPPRSLDSHKGDYGRVLVIGGDKGFGGAALMAGKMAARAGAGLIGVATQQDNVGAIIATQPELMAVGVASGQELLPLLQKPDVLVVGPGLGQTPWSEQLLYHSLHAQKTMVLDADALNLIAIGNIQLPEQHSWILTPHPGEAARLLKTSIHEIQEDRVAAAKAIQQQYGGAVILKGAGSIVVSSQQTVYVCDAGNPGMASGGMGDVLSGLLGALLAQGLSIDEAACLGTVLHATAGDLAANESGPRGLLATDLIDYVRWLLNDDGI